MAGLNKQQYDEVVKLWSMLPKSSLSFGIVNAVDTENRRVKLRLEPTGVEIGWCRVMQGAFCDKTGLEVFIAAVKGYSEDEYVVIGIIE